MDLLSEEEDSDDDDASGSDSEDDEDDNDEVHEMRLSTVAERKTMEITAGQSSGLGEAQSSGTSGHLRDRCANDLSFDASRTIFPSLWRGGVFG